MNDFSYPVIENTKFCYYSFFLRYVHYFPITQQRLFRQIVVSMSKIDDRLHIIISGDHGNIFSIPCSKRRLLLWGGVAGSLLFCASILFVGTIALSLGKLSLFTNTSTEQSLPAPFTPAFSSQTGQQPEKIEELQQEIAALKEEKQRQRMQFEQEREALLGETMEELDSRSKMLEDLFRSVGIIIPKKKKILLHNEESGGLFHEVSPVEAQKDELVSRLDYYLKKASAIPLGKPLNGRVTSRFGKRRDPLNGRVSFHDGVDIKGRRGAKIYATAEGIITRAGYNGGYGNYVEVQHRDGYKTAYAHMKNILVKRGQRIHRGDVIGLVGNTGRSTGPHLHYEIRRNNTPLNPAKYMYVAAALKKHSR